MELSQVLQALRNADAAGDVEGAKRLAQIARQLQTAAPAPALEQVPARAGFNLKDVATAFGQGAAGSVKAITDAFGADNAASQALGDVSQSLQGSYTPERQAELSRAKARMDAAEKQGFAAEAVAGIRNVAEAPLQSLAQGAGSLAPYLGLGAVTGGTGLLPSVARFVLGAIQGAGSAKSSIYDSVYDGLRAQGMDEAQARDQAVKAQEYASQNADQILINAGAGAIAGGTGAERLLGKGVGKTLSESVKRRVLTEMPKEFLGESAQGAAERVAGNVALDRAGVETPTFQGAVGAGVQEGLTGALTAGPLAAMRGPGAEKRAEEEKRQRDAILARMQEQEAPPAPADVAQQYDALQALTAQRAALKARLDEIGKTDDPLLRAERKGITDQLKAIGEQAAPLAADLFKRNKEVQALLEQRRTAAMSPEDVYLEGMGLAPGAASAGARRKAAGLSAGADQARQEAEGMLGIAPADQADTAVQDYVTEQVEAARSVGAISDVDLLGYLLKDRGLATRAVAEKPAIPGMSRKQSNALYDVLKLQVKAQDKADVDAAKAAAANARTGAQTRLQALEGEEADVQAQREAQERAEAEARDVEDARLKKITPEVLAQRRMARAASMPTGFGMFGQPYPQTPSSPAMGQMQQKLTGQDVTATAEDDAARTEEEKSNAGARRVPGQFRLFNTPQGLPNNAQTLEERTRRLLDRDDLNDRTRAFLERVANAIPRGDTQISQTRQGAGATDTATTDNLFSALDAQLTAIEQGQEGVLTPDELRLQAFPTQEAAQANVAPASAATKTSLKTQREDIGAAAPSDAEVQRRYGPRAQTDTDQSKRKPAAVEAGERATAQTGAGVPVEKRVSEVRTEGQGGRPILRGDRARAPLSRQREIEEILGLQERMAEDSQTGQQELFPESPVTAVKGEGASTEISRGAIKPTREEFVRLLNSPTVRKARKMLANFGRLNDNEKKLAQLSKRATDLQARLQKMLEAQEAYKTAEQFLKNNKEFADLQRELSEIKAAFDQRSFDKKVLESRMAELRNTRRSLIEEGRALGESVEPDLLNDLDAVEQEMQDLSADAALVDAAIKTMDMQLRVVDTQRKLGLLREQAPFQADINDTKREMQALKAELDALREQIRPDQEAERREIGDAARAEKGAADAEYKGAVDRFAKALYDRRQEILDAFFNGLSSTGTRFRALTQFEREQRGMDTVDDEQSVTTLLKSLEKRDLASLQLEAGRLEKELDEWTKKVNAAKARTAMYLTKEGKKEAAGVTFAGLRPGEYLTAEQIERDALAAGQSGTKQGPDTSRVVTFKGLGAAISAQARIATQLDALRDAIDVKQAQGEARMQRAEARKPAEITTREEQDIEERMEAQQRMQAQRDTIERLQKLAADAAAEGDQKLADVYRADVVAAEKRLAKEMAEDGLRPAMPAGRVGAGARQMTSAPGKLRAGTKESKANAGTSKQPLVEERTVRDPVRTQEQQREAEREANRIAAEERAKTLAYLRREIAEKTQERKEATSKAQKQKIAAQINDAQERLDDILTKQAVTEQQRRYDDSVMIANRAREELKLAEDAVTDEFTLPPGRRVAGRTAKLQAAAQAARTKYEAANRAVETAKDALASAQVVANKARKKPLKVPVEPDEDEGYGPGDDALFQQAQESAEAPLSDKAQAALRNDDVVTALKDVAKNSSNPLNRAVATRLAALLGDTQVVLDPNLKNDKGEPAFGAASGDGLTIWLNPTGGVNEETLLHEATHAATERVLRMDDALLSKDTLAAKRELQALHAAIKRDADITSVDAKDSLSEFVAEAMSNPVLQAQMAKKPWRLQNAWENFQKLVLRLLGITIPPTNQRDAAMAAIDTLFRAPKAEQAAAGGTRYQSKRESIIARDRTWRDTRDANAGLAFRTQFIDRYAPLEKVASYIKDSVAGMQMMSYLRLYGQRMSLVGQAVSNGALQITEKTRKDGKTERLIESRKGASLKMVAEELRDGPLKDAKRAEDLFTLDLLGRRAARVGWDKLDFKEPDRVKAEVAAARAEIASVPGLRESFDRASALYNDYNKGMMQFMVQTGAISKDTFDELTAAGDYVPFYRQRGGNADLIIGKETPIRIGNLKDSPHLKELVGGATEVLPFMTSAVQNTSLLTDLAIRNIGAKNVAFEMATMGLGKIGEGSTAGTNVIEFKDKGVDKYLLLDEEAMADIGIPADLLVKGLAGIPTMLPAGMRLLAMPARLLRKAVTLSPVYAARQLFRDSLAASMTSGANFTPVLSSLKQLGKKGATTEALNQRGITGGQVFTGTGEDISKILRDITDGKSPMRMLGQLEALSMEADAATRRAQYDSYIKQGLSEMEATMMSLESMNFTRQGLSPTVHMIGQLVPFFNAQIQGLDVLYRALRGRMPMDEQLQIRRKLITRGTMLAVSTLAYAAAMQDDEAYKNATPEERAMNWFVRVPGLDEPVRVPIPFEIGYVFKALPEALFNTMAGDQTAQEGFKTLNTILLNTMPGGSNMATVNVNGYNIPLPLPPLPQAFKPAIEAWTGTSLFTRRPLETGAEAALEPGYRAKDNTSEIAKELGQLTGMSPIIIENTVRGYTSALGLMVMQLASAAFPESGGPEKAVKRLSELPLIGTAFQPNDGQHLVTTAYERLKEIEQVKATFEKLAKSGERAEAERYLQENINKLSMAAAGGNMRSMLDKIVQAERAVRAASGMTGQEKREQLDELRRLKIEVASSIRASLETR